MAPPFKAVLSAVCLLAATPLSFGQQAVGSPDRLGGLGATSLSAVTPYGMPLAQNEAAIEQSRLYRQSAPPVGSIGVDANGSAVADSAPATEEDDSFGAQQILKTQERRKQFVVSGGASVTYTSNVGLTRRDTKEDLFAVADAGITWLPKISQNLEASVGLRASVFRYDKVDALDFQNLGFGAGLAWSPPTLRGVSVFGRYDLSELLNRHGDEILTDHTFTLGVQKALPLGRSHGLVFGATAMLGISDPSAAQRSQLGGFVSYHLQLTRHFESDFLYRPAVHFYTNSGRTDFNQILSWNLRYRLTEWADVNATFSYSGNRSDRSVFDYNVGTTGVGAGVAIKF